MKFLVKRQALLLGTHLLSWLIFLKIKIYNFVDFDVSLKGKPKSSMTFLSDFKTPVLYLCNSIENFIASI